MNLLKDMKVKKYQFNAHIFYLGDVLDCLKEIEDNSVDLVFTSLPYNVGIEYENWNDWWSPFSFFRPSHQ